MFTLTREKENPLLSPDEKHPWEAAAAFNWCPVKVGKVTHALYRALSLHDLLDGQHRNVSVIGHTTSTDGIHFSDRTPLIVPEYDFEKYGCEDPRVTKLGTKYYIFYTALSTYPFSPDGIRVAVAITKDFKKIDKKALVTPFNAKAMALFPAKIGKKMAALVTVNTDYPPADICYVEFDSEDDMYSADFWNNWKARMHDYALPLRRRPGDQVELGAPPLKTDHGWLVFYSHIQNYGSGNVSFGIEALLLDLDDPRNILGRTKGSIMAPEAFYERAGLVPNLAFPSGALIKKEKGGDVVELYYGAADTHAAIARMPLDLLLKALVPNTGAGLKRSPKNPILVPRPGVSWEARGTLNPAAIDLGGSVHILYRAVDTDNVSTIGYARSRDGIGIDERSDKPIYVPRADFERRGCEDPRVSKIGDRIYMVYTGYDGGRPRVAITSISEADFLAKNWNWTPPEVLSPDSIDDKDACILPSLVSQNAGPHGSKQYLILHRVSDNICGDYVPSLDFSQHKIDKCIDIMAPRHGMWDGWKIGISAPPIRTDRGWLLYHGVSTTPTYRVGAALLDLDDPTVVIARAALPILEPVEAYEREGGPVHNVVFPCGIVERDGILYVYYGGADYCTGVATAKLSDVLEMFE